MAGAGNRGGAGRAQRPKNERTYAYVEGTAVRQLNAPRRQPKQAQGQETSLSTRKNRERALQMNLAYVLFLSAAAVVTMFMCITFLQLQAQNTLLQKRIVSLQTQLDEAILENDSDYNRIMTGIDLEHVRDVAENELGMTQAKEGQIVTYEVENGDYVRQYTDIPE